MKRIKILLIALLASLCASCISYDRHASEGLDYEYLLTVYPPAAEIDIPLLVYFPKDGRYVISPQGLLIEEVIVDGEKITPWLVKGSGEFNEIFYGNRNKGIGWLTVSFYAHTPNILSARNEGLFEGYPAHNQMAYTIEKPVVDVKEIVFKYRCRYSDREFGPLNTARVFLNVSPTKDMIYLDDSSDKDNSDL